MRGLDPALDWTHLLPGLIVAGVGAGLVNVPLASTAVGVVEPARAGMASGINSTFRQVGIATGIAALGSFSRARCRSSMISHLNADPLPRTPTSSPLGEQRPHRGGAASARDRAPLCR